MHPSSLLPHIRNALRTIRLPLTTQRRHLSLLLAAQVPLFYDPNLPIGARPESAFQNRSEHAEEAWREMPSVKQITSYTGFVFPSASKQQFVLWTHKRPQEIIGRMTVQEALDNHLKPGMYLAPNQAVEGEVAPACMQYELRNLHMKYQEDSSLPRSRVLNIRDLGSSSQVRDMLKKATLFLRQHEKVETHVRRPEGMTTEEFLHNLKNSLHLRPDALLRALPRNSQLLIAPQASEDEVCWAYGPVLKHKKAGRLLDQGPKKQPSLTNIFYKRRNVQRRREREAYRHKSEKLRRTMKLQIEEELMEAARELETAEMQETKMISASKPSKFQPQPQPKRRMVGYIELVRNQPKIRRLRSRVSDRSSADRRSVEKPFANTQTQVQRQNREMAKRRGAVPSLGNQI